MDVEVVLEWQSNVRALISNGSRPIIDCCITTSRLAVYSIQVLRLVTGNTQPSIMGFWHLWEASLSSTLKCDLQSIYRCFNPSYRKWETASRNIVGLFSRCTYNQLDDRSWWPLAKLKHGVLHREYLIH